MKVRYIGPYESVDVQIPGSLMGVTVTVARGEWFETSAEHAKSLCEQEDTWSREGVTETKTARKRAAAKKEPTVADLADAALNPDPSEED